MPEYQYECTVCGEQFEMLCKMQDHQSEPDCPECKGKCVQTWYDGKAPDWSFHL